MINPDLLRYIQTATASGSSREIIRQNLATQGWNAQDIEAAFSALSSPAVPLQTSPAASSAPITAAHHLSLGKIILSLFLVGTLLVIVVAGYVGYGIVYNHSALVVPYCKLITSDTLGKWDLGSHPTQERQVNYDGCVCQVNRMIAASATGTSSQNIVKDMFSQAFTSSNTSCTAASVKDQTTLAPLEQNMPPVASPEPAARTAPVRGTDTSTVAGILKIYDVPCNLTGVKAIVRKGMTDPKDPSTAFTQRITPDKADNWDTAKAWTCPESNLTEFAETADWQGSNTKGDWYSDTQVVSGTTIHYYRNLKEVTEDGNQVLVLQSRVVFDGTRASDKVTKMSQAKIQENIPALTSITYISLPVSDAMITKTIEQVAAEHPKTALKTTYQYEM